MKCPICGKENTLSVCYLYQYNHIYKLCKNSNRMSKRYKVEDAGSTEQAILTCSSGCNVNDLLWWLNDDNKLIIIPSPRKFIYNKGDRNAD